MGDAAVAGAVAGAVVLGDPGPLARLEVVKADGGVPGVVFQRLSEGETLRDIGRAWGVPVGGFTRWFSEEHCVLYEAALRVRADQLAHEALACADGADAETVAPARLQVDTRLKLAGKWDRERYGERTDMRAGGVIPVLVIEIAGSPAVATVSAPRVIEGSAVSDAEEVPEPI